MQSYLTGGTQKRTLKPGVTPIYSSTGGGEQEYVANYDLYSGTSYQSPAPWSSGSTQGQVINPESDYVTTGTPGIADTAASLYGTTGQTQAQKDFNTQQQGLLTSFNNDQSLNQSIWNNGAKANSGQFDTNITAASYSPSVTSSTYNPEVINSSYAPSISAAQGVNAQQVNLQSARAAQGALDPTTAMQSLLSGTPNNPYLSQQASALTAASNQNLQQNIMPGIGNSAQAAGQYGSSRQGIAQGVAAGNAQTGLDSSIANLYSNAYAQAQQNMYGTANNLNTQAGQNAQNNAAIDLQAQTTNSNTQLANNAQQMTNQLNSANVWSQNNAQNMQNSLNSANVNAQNNSQNMQNSLNGANVGLQNNAQTMTQAQNSLNNRVTGSNLITGGLAAQNSLGSALNSSYDATRNQPWTDLAQYQSVIQPLAGMGNSSTLTSPYYTNTAANIIGGASEGLGLGNKLASALGSSSSSSALPSGWSGTGNNAYYDSYGNPIQ